MKHILFALILLPLSAAATEVSDLRLVRVLNGTGVNCTTMPERGKPTFFLSNAEASATDKELSLFLTVDYSICRADGDHLFFEARRPLDTLYYKHDDGSEIRVESRDPEFLITGDRSSILLVQDAENQSSQRPQFQIPFEKLLSAAQKKSLADGKDVKLRLQFVARSIATYTIHGVTKPLGRRSEGMFTIFLTLRK